MSSNSIIAFLKRCIRAGQTLFWLGLGLFGLGILTYLLLREWPGDRLLPVRLLNYFMPWLLLGLLPALAVAGLARHWKVALLLVAPTLLITLTFAPLFLPRPKTVLAAGPTVKVMSYNVWARNHDITDLTRLIRQEQPDLVLMQEISAKMKQTLTTELVDLYPTGEFNFAYEPRGGQLVISRYPLTPLEFIPGEGQVQKVRAETPAGPINVWNVHALQPLPWSRQYWQMTALAQDIAVTPGPLIVGGDFNTTDQSDAYRLINQNLQNAHWEAGWGLGFSFPSIANRPNIRHLPLFSAMVRIDHIFYSHHFFARNAQTLAESGGSDHFPIVAELSFVEQ